MSVFFPFPYVTSVVVYWALSTVNAGDLYILRSIHVACGRSTEQTFATNLYVTQKTAGRMKMKMNPWTPASQSEVILSRHSITLPLL